MKLSILTPTYNRAELLKRCYQSLCNQTCLDFEWIIIDDGSIDDTSQLVKHFTSDDFEIKYVKKENGGKHTALNYAQKFLTGDYLLILDSDDFLENDAVATIFSIWNQFYNDSDIGVVSFYRKSSTGEIISFQLEDDVPYVICSSLEYRINGNRIGDQAEVVRMEYFKKFQFPEYPGENFAPEGLFWNYIGYKYKTVYVNKAIYVCDYLEGGLTDRGAKLLLENPKVMMDYAKTFFNHRICAKERMKQGILYIVYAIIDRRSIWNAIHCSNQPFLESLLLPFGFLLYLFCRYRYLS